jgi:hypothetical protein
MSDQSKCETCRFWDQKRRSQSTPKLAPCRRMPPRVSNAGATIWPETNATDWCGKHATTPTWMMSGQNG